MTDLINTTDFNTRSQASISITGGVAVVDLYHINPKSTTRKSIIVSTTFQTYSKFFKDNARATLGNMSNALNGGIMIVETDRNGGLNCVRVGTANNDYNGQLVVTLGY